MGLPAPNLDDRQFQDLVDEAKRLVQRRCPEWSDHNVSDPGVALIETFAYMVDLLLYRLNRVPERNYVKFLDLIGLQLFPPTAARTGVTLWLSAPQSDVLTVPAGTEVASLRTIAEEEVSFTTVEDLAIVPCSMTHVVTLPAGTERPENRTGDLAREREIDCFADVPAVGDALYIGLSAAVPSCAVALRVDCRIDGIGVDPTRPPLVWEAWDGTGWAMCEVDRDETGGLNRSGDVVLHMPTGHTAHLLPGLRLHAGWLRCRVTDAEGDQPVYGATPRLRRVDAYTIGGTVDAVHATVVRDEILGMSEGVPGQTFTLANAPVVPADRPIVLEVSTTDGWQEWQRVEHFAASGPEDHHFTMDSTTGEIVLGPALRDPDGSLRNQGAVPAKDATLRVQSYRTGGGAAGNLAAGALSVLTSSIPFVTSVENRHPASGGVDGEDLESAKLRAPILLRTRDRAVTAEDYEAIARRAAPEVARVRCAPAAEADNAVRLLVVPAVGDDEDGRLPLESLVPRADTLESIRATIDSVRVAGSRVVIEPPFYTGVTVVARLRSRAGKVPDRVRAAALRALHGYFHPLRGGPDGTGWPFGHPVQVGEVYAVLQRVPGVALVEDARVFAADPITGERGEELTRLEIDRHSLVISYDHQVRVEP